MGTHDYTKRVYPNMTMMRIYLEKNYANKKKI